MNINKIIEVEAACDCPFRYTTDGEAQAETWYPGDDMCNLDDKECHGYLGTGCLLVGGVIQIVPIPHPMDGDTLCTTCGKQGAALCECCGHCGAGPDETCDCP